MDQQEPAAMLYFIIAPNALEAAVFRRGPSNWVQLVLWDFVTDKIELGQWINKKVNTRNASLSPEGNYMIYSFSSSPTRKRNVT